MIFVTIIKSVQVFNEIHHRVARGKIVQRTDVGVVKMVTEKEGKIMSYVVPRTAKRASR